MTVHVDGLTIDWLGYATVRIEGPETIVYVDPGRYGVLTGEWTADSETAAEAHPPATDYRPEDGDALFVTHRHHYDPDGIERVASDDATCVTFDGINFHQTARTDVRPADLPYEVRSVGLESQGIVGDVTFWTISAYNHPDGPHTRPDGSPVHPEGLGCGYLLSVDGTRVFVAGDTDVLEGHAQLDVDVFVPPIGGTYTMDRHAAADLADAMAPELVVPVHYNTFEAIETDSEAFAADLDERGVAVELDEE
ncbi:MBL fold metallo-hydrolase [Salinibaculum rarum]|uniref:MBL fold metallo-hydrolase n=1 Tax=Salinibaculum rarum TaxID=3058903 RepID=UPI00265EAF93|nr:MBL fold metallo-hydrolase [Salinibaculum sp. KK48]